MTKTAKTIKIGPLTIGGNNPVLVQSMTNTHTCDIEATIAQIERLTAAGCELIRVAVPTPQDTAALPAIIKAVKIPLVADVHFHYKRALEAIEAGVVKIRLNPGNIQDRQQVNEVIAACKANGTAIRIGVNEGSIVESKDKALR
ncbi:MAG: flavodoxin-dependent (E)-4-hydroxy-3-methylbut-2-enyl-diphosphate synthase, partial [Sedimentisphaerales bacterium]|nr:flavodoxin-dependent (E)-4-hydroxy-3-methylbut-2-enyl-diphosphate synthase [Sedimentisphaerales bacterium]